MRVTQSSLLKTQDKHTSYAAFFATGIICFLVATIVDIVWLGLGLT